MGRLASIVAVACLSVTLAACGGGATDQAFLVTPENERKAAPDISVKALSGDGTLTLGELRGKPVVLNFWGSYCPPCIKETPDLVAFAKAHPGVHVVGVAVSDVTKDARAFAVKFKVPYLLGNDLDGNTVDAFGFPGLPATYFLDAEGRFAADPKFGPVVPRNLDAFAAALGA